MSVGVLGQTPRLSGGLSVGAVVALAACVALLAQQSTVAALALSGTPLVALLTGRPQTAGILGIGLLPFATDVVGGGPVKVSLSDALLLLAVVTVAASTRREAGRALVPMLPLLAAYTAVLSVAVAAHLDLAALVNSAQRLQIVLVPLVVGAAIVSGRRLRHSLDLYVLISTLLAVAWSLDALPEVLEYQKNPVGRYIAAALLVVAADPSRRARLLAVPPLAVGLLQSESRGALLGLLVGLLVLVVARPGADKLRTAAVLVPVLVLLGVAYNALPDDVQERTATLRDSGPGAGSSGQYTIQLRAAYREDALEVIRRDPLTGVGIGNYLAGNSSDGTLTDDPHNVLLLEAAEGGVPLVGALTVLVVGSSALLWRRRTSTPYAAIALAVQAATVANGLVDVYWVRGTPVLGWLLVGVALADAERRRRAADEG